MKKDGGISALLIEESFKSAFKKCIPLITTLEITQHCNLKCSHCYNFDRKQNVPEIIKNNYLNDSEIFKAIEAISNLGALYLNLSGGEALLHPKISEFIKHARDNHIEPRLKSNGLLLTEKKMESLYQAGLRSIDVSLYGASNQVYEDFSGVREGYDKTLNGIIEARKFDIEMSLNIILHIGNVDQLGEMIELAHRYNMNFAVSLEVTERYDGSLGAREHEITESQFESLLLGPHKEHFQFDNSDKALQCGCARAVCGINAVGDVYPCIGAPIHAGNIKDNSLEEIWLNSPVFEKIRNLKTADFKSCSSCKFIESCARSSGSVYVNTGEYTGCDSKILEQAKIRNKHL